MCYRCDGEMVVNMTEYEMKMPLKDAKKALDDILNMEKTMTTFTGWQIGKMKDAVSTLMYVYHANKFQRKMSLKLIADKSFTGADGLDYVEMAVVADILRGKE